MTVVQSSWFQGDYLVYLNALQIYGNHHAMQQQHCCPHPTTVLQSGHTPQNHTLHCTHLHKVFIDDRKKHHVNELRSGVLGFNIYLVSCVLSTALHMCVCVIYLERSLVTTWP